MAFSLSGNPIGGRPIFGGMFHLPQASTMSGLGQMLMSMGQPGGSPGVQVHPPLASQGAVAHQGYTNPLFEALARIQQNQQGDEKAQGLLKMLQEASGPTSQAGWALGTKTQPAGLLDMIKSKLGLGQ